MGGPVEDRQADVGKVLERAEGGDVKAQRDLASLYLRGKEVKLDYDEAAAWLKKAADQGDADSQLGLGRLYAEGNGVEEDDVEALRLYQLAAEQGLANAQFNIGLAYAYGEGTERDPVEALKWYRLAADQDNPQAQLNIGFLYHQGEGVERDPRAQSPVARLHVDDRAAEPANLGEQCRADVRSDIDFDSAVDSDFDVAAERRDPRHDRPAATRAIRVQQPRADLTFHGRASRLVVAQRPDLPREFGRDLCRRPRSSDHGTDDSDGEADRDRAAQAHDVTPGS